MIFRVKGKVTPPPPHNSMRKIQKFKNSLASKNLSDLNEEGVTLSTIIIISIAVLAAIAAAIIIYNVVSDSSDEIEEVLEEVTPIPATSERPVPPVERTTTTTQPPAETTTTQPPAEATTTTTTTTLPTTTTQPEEPDEKRIYLPFGPFIPTFTTSSTRPPPSPAAQVSTGAEHTCAVLRDATIRCAGRNNLAQLGDGTRVDSNVPVQVDTITSAAQVSAGVDHTCAVLADNPVTEDNPETDAIENNEEGIILCWGWNGNGQLGDGTTSPSLTPSLDFPVLSITTATQVSAGRDHTCALLADDPTTEDNPATTGTVENNEEGMVMCWGEGNNGKLGNGASTASDTPVSVSNINTATQVSAGDFHTCALLADNTVQCWGLNDVGQLGDGGAGGRDSDTPVQVSNIATATQISVGRDYSCAVLADGTVQCWGEGSNGQLGNGATGDSNIPVTVSVLTNPDDPNSDLTPLTDVAAVSARELHTCALMRDGTVQCWGSGNNGELLQIDSGQTREDSLFPVEIPGITSAVEIAVGPRGFHTCVLLRDESIRCWGPNNAGQLGDATVLIAAANSAVSVIAVPEITTAAQVSPGRNHTCAVLENGTVSCWGRNADGQLGDGTTTGSRTPVQVSIATAAQVSAGARHSCAVLENGTVSCWGRNADGQLGNGRNAGSNRPVQVSIATAAQVSAGDRHTCAVLEDNTVMCWGLNDSGQLGDTTTTSSNTPVLVTGITTATQVSAGASHSCAVLEDNTVRCWGAGGSGRLGNGATSDAGTSVLVTGITTATQVSAGARHSCARLSTGRIQLLGSWRLRAAWKWREPVMQALLFKLQG